MGLGTTEYLLKTKPYRTITIEVRNTIAINCIINRTIGLISPTSTKSKTIKTNYDTKPLYQQSIKKNNNITKQTKHNKQQTHKPKQQLLNENKR